MVCNHTNLLDFVYYESIDVVLLTETWLSDKHLNQEILSHNYHIFRTDRKCKVGGGVLVALKDSSFDDVKQVAIDQFPDLEIVCVECSSSKDPPTLVVCCYRPPNSTRKWLLSFKELLDWANRVYKKIIISGDFNLPKISWSEAAVIPSGDSETFFCDSLTDLYFSQLIYIPTRDQNILDLLITNIPEKIANIEVTDPTQYGLFSDHNYVLFDYTGRDAFCHKINRTVYDYKRADFEGMNRALETSQFDWMTHDSTSDINDDWASWRDNFLTIANIHIPQKTIKGRHNPPWITGEILNVLKKKETLRRKLRRSIAAQAEAIMNKYKTLRSTAKKLIKDSREHYFASLSESLYSNPKRFWSFFKTSTKTDRIPTQVSIATDTSSRISSSSAVDNANLFNRYFNSVFLEDSGDTYSPLPLLSNETITEIILEPSEVYSALYNLNPSKASGPDKITTRVLKECASSITPSLTHLFNKSLNTGNLPTEWKLSDVIPLHKKGDKSYVENYRPISLLCVVSKVLERCIYNRLVERIQAMISDKQYGFMRGKSCAGQLLSVLDHVGKSLDIGQQTDILYLDIAKAFDTVDHKLLLQKLRQFGLEGKILNWFSNYLSGRQQRVLVHGATSDPLAVTSGVPQGSILGPLLFSLYINDLPSSISSASVNTSLFADDTKCFSTIESHADALVLSNEVKNVENWAQDWRVKFNADKCKVLSVTRKHNPIVAKYVVDDRAVQHVSSQKDLGVTISSDLSWNIHIHEQVTKANRLLGMVKRSTAQISDVNTRRTLYLTLVRSNLAYACQVWSPQNVVMCSELEKIQRRATKYIMTLPFDTDVAYKERLLALNMLPLSYWHEFLDVLFLFKTTRGLIANDLEFSNLTNNQHHVMNLRSHSTTLITYHIPKTKTLCQQNSYAVRVSRIWNTLPDEVRLPDISLHSFKRLLFQYYFSATGTVYDVEQPKSWKTICPKCHQARQLSLAKNCCF